MSANRDRWHRISGRRRVALVVLVTVVGCTGQTGGTAHSTADTAGRSSSSTVEPSSQPAVVGHVRSSTATTWFAPYVDATLTPVYQFQDRAENPAKQTVLSFIVSDLTDPCTPSWGGFYSLTQASKVISLDRRVGELEAAGGTAIVSFGGEANRELALGCDSVTKLEAAYRSVINRYGLQTVDFDIEGSALTDAPSIQRRARALAEVQRSMRAAGHDLAIWLTLPVATDGLQPDALDVVTQTLHDGVNLAGVNAMTMDFGPPEPNMWASVKAALGETQTQLGAIYRQDGVILSSSGIWHKIGATVMIGQNDSAGELFTLADAKALTRLARADDLGRVSMWSLNRDRQCSDLVSGSATAPSNTCSSMAETPLGFTRTFAQLGGSSASAAQATTPSPTSPAALAGPSHDPYPVWSAEEVYVRGYRVVRDGEVYLAKWYNQADDPARTTAATIDPWELLRPVLASDHAPTTTTLPVGTYPTWSSSAVYQKGTRVLFGGRGFVARWYNQTLSPAAATIDATSSPWRPLFAVPGEPITTGP